MVDINLFQRFQSPDQAHDVVRDASAGYMMLVFTHLIMAGWWNTDEPKSMTLIGNDSETLIKVQLAGAALSAILWFAMRKTGSEILAWVLLVWCAAGLYHPLTFNIYGFASKWAFMVMGIYFGALAIRASRARSRLRLIPASSTG